MIESNKIVNSEMDNYKFPIEDFESISINVYKNLLVEAKEAFNSQAVETISVTSKTIQYIIGSLSFLLTVIAYLYSDSNRISWVFILPGAISLYAIYTAFQLIRARNGYELGLLPEHSLSKKLNDKNEFSDEYKEKQYYYFSVWAYADKTIKTKALNKDRSILYDRLLTSIILTIVTTVILAISVMTNFSFVELVAL